MSDSFTIVVCAATEMAGWRWLADRLPKLGLDWRFVYYRPIFLSMVIRKPDLRKVWSGWRAAWQARRLRADLIISQEAESTFWSAFFCRLLGVTTPHVAIAFNYPHRPHGLRLWLMQKAFERVHRFDVSSQVEKNLYIEYFCIPAARLDVQLWKMRRWDSSGATPLIAGDYVCALGEYGRDYPTMLKAIARLPHINFVLVVRPYSLQGLHIPPNAKVLENIPHQEAYNIINFSRFMVLPLATSEMPTGHITLVTAMHLAKAVVVTQSAGISDYVRDDDNALTFEAGDDAALAERIKTLWQDPVRCLALGERAMVYALDHCSEEAAVIHLKHLLLEYGAGKWVSTSAENG